jgi:iron complex outermembrane receptor protein
MPVEQITVRANAPDGVTNRTPGGGLMPIQKVARAQSGITRDYIAQQSPTTNVTNLIASLPGAVVPVTDPLGTTPDQLTMRGFNQTQIGYLFEGSPLAEPITYQPHSASYVDAENIGTVTVSQGAPDATAPFLNATGGEVSENEITPSQARGGYIDLVGGSFGTNKEFLRLNTGYLGDTGIRGFVSFSHLSNDNWRGPGGQLRYHLDTKFLKQWGEDNSIAAIFGFNRDQYTGFINPTLAQWEKYGYNLNYSDKYYPGNVNYYKLNRDNDNMFDVLVPMSFTLSDSLKLHFNPYVMDRYGPAVNGETIPQSGGYFGTQQYGNLGVGVPLPNGMITTEVFDPFHETTSGFNSSLDWISGSNTFSIGYWYSYTVHKEEESFSPLNNQGESANAYGAYPIRLPNGSILSGYNLNFTQQVNSLLVADTLKLLDDRLVLTGGFRAAMVSRQGTNDIPGANPYINIKNYFEPLPQVSVSYQLTPQDQVFVDSSTSFRTPQSVEALSQIFDPSSPIPQVQPGNLKPEYSIAEEIGFRHYGFVNFAISAFNINETNHQVTSTGYLPGTNQFVLEPINVGGQTSRGVDAELGLGHWNHFSPYISGQYLRATIDNDFNAGAGYLPTAGKTAVASPAFSGAFNLQYNDDHLFGNLAVRYVGSQYSTFMNDQSIPSHVTADLSLGYRFDSIWAIKHPRIMLNLMNITDNKYLSGPSSFTATAETRKAIDGQTITGSSPVYFIGSPLTALISISSSF